MLDLFSSTTRLYDLTWRDEGPAVMVEAWWSHAALSGGFELCIDVLATDAHIALERFLGQALTLHSALPDGTRSDRSGLVRTARSLGADGGFGRYRLVVVPWSWLLTRSRHNRVFQDKSVIEIADTVFGAHAPFAAWQWSEEVSTFLAGARPRSYCVQYQESDYAFVSRLLAEEGLGWCVEADEDAPAGHRLRIFADSAGFLEDVQSANGGIRFHRADSQEDSDAITALGAHRQLGIGIGAALSYDYKRKRAVAASLPSVQNPGGEHAPVLEHYDDAGAYAWACTREAERYQKLMLEAREARFKAFLGRGTVRSFYPGESFRLTESLLDALDPTNEAGDEGRFVLLELTEAGINNLSGEAIEAIAERLAADLRADEDDDDNTDEVVAPVRAPQRLDAEVVKLATARGYGNSFTAQRAKVPWRPILADGTGARMNPRATAPGPMTAIVVGPQGETTPNGADELWCDRLGRIKVRFHWQRGEQPDDRLTCWLRPMARQASAGMGWQWLPRIGQEVAVGFLNDDIDRPVILGAFYNGRGDGGIAPTPGGEASETDTRIFEEATDHSPAGQGNLTGGNSPAWHGGAEVSHNHAAALSGFKSKEFGAHGTHAGYNQIVFDDSDEQLRTQLKSSTATSELNLGHLVHQADNYRGSFRGTGFELRTDAWGALRGGRGVIMSTWAQTNDGEPAGDLAAGKALIQQAGTLADTLSGAAKTHETVQLAASIGSHASENSTIDPGAAPLKALHTVLSGMVDALDSNTAKNDARAKRTAIGTNALPHLTDAAIVQSAKAGLGMVAGQHLHWSAGETISLISGQDTDLVVAGSARIHTGQAIGLLAGAIRPGEDDIGIRLIAAKDAIDMQAQSDEMKFQAKEDLKLVSARAHIDFAAAKKIHLAVEGGASITIDGGITVQCPGTITVHASKKSFSGPDRMDYPLPGFPDDMTNPLKRHMRFSLGALPDAMTNYAGEPYRLFADGAMIDKGVADDSGAVGWEHVEGTAEYKIELMTGARFVVKAHENFADDAAARGLQHLSNRGYRSHEHASDVPATFGAVGDAFRNIASRRTGED